jgi:hypothetical protein
VDRSTAVNRWATRVFGTAQPKAPIKKPKAFIKKPKAIGYDGFNSGRGRHRTFETKSGPKDGFREAAEA